MIWTINICENTYVDGRKTIKYFPCANDIEAHRTIKIVSTILDMCNILHTEQIMMDDTGYSVNIVIKKDVKI